jgi:hypothetical protein
MNLAAIVTAGPGPCKGAGRQVMDRRAGAGYLAGLGRRADRRAEGEMTLTEAEWLESTDPQKMLDFLRGKARDRKLRLFAVAGCRRIWHVLKGRRDRDPIRVAEAYADAPSLAPVLPGPTQQPRSSPHVAAFTPQGTCPMNRPGRPPVVPHAPPSRRPGMPPRPR